MLVMMWSSKNSRSLLVEMQNGTATLEESLAVSYKTKQAQIIWPSNHAPWFLAKVIENLCLHKNLYTDVYSSFIHDCQNLGATKMSFGPLILSYT